MNARDLIWQAYGNCPNLAGVTESDDGSYILGTGNRRIDMWDVHHPNGTLHGWEWKIHHAFPLTIAGEPSYCWVVVDSGSAPVEALNHVKAFLDGFVR